MDGIVQNELFIGTELGIVSGFELSVLHMVNRFIPVIAGLF